MDSLLFCLVIFFAGAFFGAWVEYWMDEGDKR